jgi:hypothetical protein
MITPELVTARRVIASPATVAHSRELGPGKQFQLPHATNYLEHHQDHTPISMIGYANFLASVTPMTKLVR